MRPPQPYQIFGENNPGGWLVTCDHASNHIPDWISHNGESATLGLTAADMTRHIAYDPGAKGVTIALAQELNSPAICSDFSRLVIDPNRGENDPTLVMQLYDGSIIPANRAISPSHIEERLDRLYRPYHHALAQLADQRAIVAVHSFTPQLRDRAPRPWHVGVLHSHLDSRLSLALIDLLRAQTDYVVGDNEPYNGHLPGDAIDRHALRHGRHNCLIEIRNDLIQTAEQQAAWARCLAPILQQALKVTNG